MRSEEKCSAKHVRSFGSSTPNSIVHPGLPDATLGCHDHHVLLHCQTLSPQLFDTRGPSPSVMTQSHAESGIAMLANCHPLNAALTIVRKIGKSGLNRDLSGSNDRSGVRGCGGCDAIAGDARSPAQQDAQCTAASKASQPLSSTISPVARKLQLRPLGSRTQKYAVWPCVAVHGSSPCTLPKGPVQASNLSQANGV